MPDTKIIKERDNVWYARVTLLRRSGEPWDYYVDAKGRLWALEWNSHHATKEAAELALIRGLLTDFNGVES